MKTITPNLATFPVHTSRPSLPRGVARIALISILFAIAFSVQAQFSPPSDGLVAWWRGNGNADDSAGGHNGTLVGGLGFRAGIAGLQAFSCTGSGRVFVPDSSAFVLTNSLTIGAWIYVDSASWIILQRGDNRSGLDPYQLSLDYTGNHVQFHIDSGTATKDLLAPIAYGQWAQVTATLDGSTGDIRIYVNGALAAEDSTAIRPFGDLDPTQQPGIGIGNTPANVDFPFLGGIGEVLLYSRALSPPEVLALSLEQEPTAPSILSQPEDQTAFLGTTATFTVEALGTQPFSYQWAKNGSDINGATANPLVLNNVQFADAGAYSVVVSNSLGTMPSSNAVLTVNPVPPCATPPSGLVSWWRSELNANDETGSDLGTLYGGSGYTNGMVGQAFTFDGWSGHVRIADQPDLSFGKELSIEAWIYPTSVGRYQDVVAKWDAGTNIFDQKSYLLGVDSNNRIYFGVSRDGTDSTVKTALSAVAVSLNRWTYVAGTYDGTTLSIYVNGQFQTSVSYANAGAIFPGTDDLAIGGAVGGVWAGMVAEPFAGRIDEASLYNRSLTPAEILSIYNASISGKCVVPVAPTIVLQPLGQTVVAGGSATFSVAASGTAPLSYQWQKNGGDLSGATANPLVLTSVQFADAAAYSVVVTNFTGSITSSTATLTVTYPPALLQAANASGQGGSTVMVPVSLVANGNENGLSFSLSFDSAKLSYVNADLGSGATGATLLQNTSLTANGKLGLALALPTDTTFSAGTQEVVQVTFAAVVATNLISTPVTFGDQPVLRLLADAHAAVLPANYFGATVTISATPLEGDVSPRPDGDEALTITDWVLVGRYAARLDYPTNASEFQRADCAPRSTLGDGAILINDWVQAGRYAVGLDPLTVAGGPTTEGPVAALSMKVHQRPGGPTSFVSVGNTAMAQGQAGTVAVDLQAHGTENALGFSLTFDPSLVSYEGTTLGGDAAGATLLVNSSQAGAGRVGYALALGTQSTFASGTRELVRVKFQATTSATGTLSTAFADLPVPRAVSDAAAGMVSASYVNGTIGVNPPPQLTIVRSDQNVVFAWPLWATNFVLQEATGPLPISGGWSDPPVTIGINNNQYVVTLQLNPETKFYRLMHP